MVATPAISLATAVRTPALLGTIPWRESQLELLDSLDLPLQLYLWILSRQVGKSTMAAAAAVHNAVLCPHLDEMMHGKWRSVPVIAVAESQSKDFGNLCASFVENSPTLAEHAEIRVAELLFRVPRTDAHGHKYTAKVAIRCLPANASSIRGLSAALVVLEEWAHHNSGTGGPADERRIWDAVGPMTTSFGRLAKTLAITTPHGESGLAFEMFRAIEGGLLPHASAVQKSITDMWADVDREWLAARRMELGESAYRQEFLAEFVGSGGSFFDLGGVTFEDEPATIPTEDASPDEQRRECHKWIAGLDPSFHNDHFGLAVIGESKREPGVWRTAALEGIAPTGGKLASFDLRRGREDKTLARVWEILRPFHEQGGGLRIVTDQHQADAVRSYFGRLGAAPKVVHLTGPTQTAAFSSLRTRLMDGSLRVHRHEQTIEELRRVRAKDASETISLPRFAGSHCDTASALALATYEIRNRDGEPEGRASGGERFMERHGDYKVGAIMDKVF